MQASVIEIILAFIRKEMVDGFLPLGALSATLQVYQISYVWSLEFISAVTSAAYTGRRRILFAITVPFLIVLTSVLGPSSAVLMIPRPGMSKALDHVDRQSTELAPAMFPSEVTSAHNMSL